MPLPFIRRHHRPGTAPGTLGAPQEKRVEEVSIRLLRWVGEEIEERVLDGATDLAAYAPSADAAAEPGTVTWIDVVGLHDFDLISEIGRTFGLHPLALEDVVNTGQRPKAEEYDGHLFCILRHFHLDTDNHRLTPEQISLFLLPGLVITFQEIEGDAFEPVRERVRRGAGRLHKRGADYLSYALIDALVDRFFPLLEALGERIENLEEELIDDPSSDSLDTIYELRRDLLHLRRTAWPKREMILSLQRDDSVLISEETRAFLRDAYDHAVEVMEVLETYRELAASMLDVYLSSVSHRMNEVMKVLTIIATLFIPLTFIAGIYGMNFQNMPELSWPWGYPVALGLMALIALALLYYFRRKDWL